MRSEPSLRNFAVSLDQVATLGAGLSRPECVLCFKTGDIFVSHRPGGVQWIRPDGSMRKIGEAANLVPNGIARLRDGAFLLANHTQGGGVYRLAADGAAAPFVLEADGLTLPPVNFVYRDHQNRIWICVSSWREGDDQYRRHINDGFVALVESGRARIVSDGFCWTNECRVDAAGETLYVNETFGRRLTRFRILPNGDLRDRAVVTEFTRDTFPDGLALDSEDGLWVVAVGSNRVIRVTQDGRQQVILEDCDDGHLAKLADALDNHCLTRPMLMNNQSKKLRNISSIAFAGDDLQTVVLGCLGGDALATFRSPVAGLAPSHWRDAV